MELKINKYIFSNITNKDWVLDNGSIYQAMTLRHRVYDTRYYLAKDVETIMSKMQFKQLVKDGLLVRDIERESKNFPYAGCKAWRFNVEENN